MERLTLTLSVLVALSLGLVAGCTGTMGTTCTNSDQCAGDGTCLKGICSGYGCDSDANCSNGYICGSVQEVKTCVLECGSDDDCGGDQVCTSVAESMEEDTEFNDYCL